MAVSFDDCDYDLEIERIKKIIRKKEYKSVCIHVPDGLKIFIPLIHKSLKDTDADIYVWYGTNYGACDIPKGIEGVVDAFITFGHSRFIKSEW